MEIRIEHIANTYNYGSLMMAISLISNISNNIADVKFYVDSVTDEDLNRLKRETGISNITRYGIDRSNNYLIKAVNKVKRLIINRKMNKIANVIIIGGDDISEYYGIKWLEKQLKKLERDSIDKNIILLGQTIGPFTGERIKLVKQVLNKVKIYTRDDNCLEYLKSIGVTTGVKGRDLAFVKLPNKSDEVLDKYNLREKEYVTIVPSGLYKWYTENYDVYINEQINIITSILENKNIGNKKIVLLSHVLKPEHVDDRKIVRDIYEKCSEEQRNMIVPITDELLASEARRILGNGYFTITGRMHAAVSTFFERKPALSLSYSVKYAGVIGEGLKRNDLVIECAGDEKWINNNVSKMVNKKIDYIIENYNSLVNEIDSEVSKTTNIVENELKDVVKYLKNKN